MRHRTLTRVIGAAAGSVLAASTVVVPAAAADPPPSYLVTYLGDGFVTGLSNTGIVIGGRTEAFRVVTPYVSTGGSPWRTLPLPTGATGATPADVNDSGINDAGQIVGGRLDILGLPTSPGWVAPAGGDPVALLDTFGFGGLPVDVTDGGVVLSAVELLDLGTGVVMPIPQGPSSYNPVAASAINEAGQLAGAATLRSPVRTPIRSMPTRARTRSTCSRTTAIPMATRWSSSRSSGTRPVRVGPSSPEARVMPSPPTSTTSET